MSLHHLGETRSRRAPDHLLQTPDTFVWAPLPGMQGATACVHVAPQLGAAFTQYSVLFEAGGTWSSDAGTSRFVYLLEGAVRLRRTTGDHVLGANSFCFVPASEAVQFQAAAPARVVVIEKPYVPLEGAGAVTFFLGDAASVPSSPLMGDDDLQVCTLVPADPAYDFAVNTMTYQPGARLSMVEVHVMEHGLLMLQGEGIYRLGDAWYPVAAGDFIWMAPFCPQWFGALGNVPAKYLIYKDWNRHPLAQASNGTRP